MPEERYIDPNSGAAPQPGAFVSPPAPTADQDGATDVGALVEDEKTKETVEENSDDSSEAKTTSKTKKNGTK